MSGPPGWAEPGPGGGGSEMDGQAAVTGCWPSGHAAGLMAGRLLWALWPGPASSPSAPSSMPTPPPGAPEWKQMFQQTGRWGRHMRAITAASRGPAAAPALAGRGGGVAAGTLATLAPQGLRARGPLSRSVGGGPTRGRRPLPPPRGASLHLAASRSQEGSPSEGGTGCPRQRGAGTLGAQCQLTRGQHWRWRWEGGCWRSDE